MKKFKLLPIIVFALLANTVFAQTANVSPNTLNSTVTQCFDSVTQQFTIGNTDANDLTFENTTQVYGFNGTKAGNIFSTHGNVYGYQGIAYHNNHVYCIAWDNLYVYNLNTGSMILGRWVLSNARSIIYDGEYLWIGNNTGRIYSFNLNGIATGNSIQLPFSDYMALAWDGECFIASDYNQNNPTIYKVDKNGSTVATYSCNANARLYSYTWVEKHAEGHLWAIDNHNKILQLKLNGTVYSIANEFAKPSGFYVYNIAHNGTDLLHSNANYTLYTFDDGVIEAENWINLSANNGTVTGNSSQQIDIEFNAKNINAGVYNADVIVKTNDPVNSADTIACTFTVTGDPEFYTLQTSLPFGNVFVNATKTDTIVINNIGCDTLKITNITTSLGVYTTNITQADIMPHDSLYLIVNFAPTSQTGYNGTLTIYNNDVNTVISLSGTGVAPPVLTVSPSTLNATVTECFDSITQQFTINNTGNGTLTFENTMQTYGFDGTKAGEIISKSNNNIYAYYGFTIIGDYLYGTRPWNFYKYNLKTETQIISRGLFSNARAVVYDGQQLWFGDNTGQLRSYNLDGISNNKTIQMPYSNFSSLTWDGEYIIAAPVSHNPTIYKLNSSGDIIETYSSNVSCTIYSFTWAANHADGHLWVTGSNGKIMQLKLVGNTFEIVNQFNKPNGFYNYNIYHDGTDLLNATYSDYKLMKFEDGVIEAENWINLSADNGTVTGNSSQQIDVEFNAKDINAGVYSADVIINSDDPHNIADTIACTFTVEGEPTIVTSETVLSYGNVFINDTKTDTIVINNTGCDTLKITNVTTTLGVYTVNFTQANIMPHDSLYLEVTFTPTAQTSYNGSLTIYNNDNNKTINLSGTGVAPPALSINPNTLNATVTECFDSITQQFTINNTGDGTLTFENTMQAYGFDDIKAGTIISKSNNSIFLYYGFTIIGDYLYGTRPWQFYKYNLKTETQVISRGLFTYARGVIYDGQQLWFGDNIGQLRSYNLDGISNNKTIQMPYSTYSSLTWDGEYILAAPVSHNPTIYKINSSGDVIETYSSNVSCTIYSFTWAANHAEGQLWATGSNGKIMQLKLVGNTFEIINQFNKPTGFYDYNIYHDGTNLLNATENSGGYKLMKFDDGVHENWINLSDDNGTVTGNSSQQIDIEFNAKDINAGVYSADVIINSDDPLNTADTIACTFTVEGEPTIVTSKNSLTFGSLFLNDTKTDTIVINNTGCDTLKITNIVSSLSEYTTNVTQTVILPKDSLYLKVKFTPTHEGDFTGTLTIFNNDADSVINLTGTGIGSPEFSVDVNVLNATVTECNESTTEQFTINNTGDGELTFENTIQTYGFDDTKAGTIISKSNNRIYLYYGFTIIGDYLYGTRPWQFYKYNLKTESLVRQRSLFSYARGVVYDGQQLWFGDNIGQLRSYNLDGISNNKTIQMPYSTYSSLTWDGEYILAAPVSHNPTIYKINSSGDVIETYSSNVSCTIYSFTWAANHAEGQLWAYGSNGKIMQLKLVGNTFEIVNQFNKPTGFYNYNIYHDGTDLLNSTENSGGYKLMRFDDGVIEADNWLSLSSESGNVSINSTQQIEATFKSENINAGVYMADIIVKSDDPLNTADTIVCTFNHEGKPQILLSDNSFDFGDVWVNRINLQTFTITNTGCDTLKIYSISSDLPDFSTDMNTFNIMPGKWQDVNATFAPTAYGMQNAELTIATNVGDSIINLTGNGLAPIIIDITTLKPDGYYNEDEVIDFLVDFDMIVNVTGTPRIKLNTLPSSKSHTNSVPQSSSKAPTANVAYYNSGSGTSQLTFRYTVGDDDNSDDLDYTTVDDLTLTGGTIRHSVSDARLMLPTVGTISDIHNIVIDNIYPATQLASITPNPTGGIIKVSANFGEIVTGFELSDIVVGNGITSNFKTLNSGALYTFNVTALTEDDVTIDVNGNVAQDLAGNKNTAATQLIVKFDNTPPTVSLSSSSANPTGDNPIVLSVRFSEDVNGLTLSDFAVSNGSATNLVTINPAQYTVDILPTATGTVTIGIPANAVKDLAQNGNIQADQFSIVSSSISPTVSLSTTSSSPTNNSPIVTTVEFSENVTGFELSDIKVTNGATSNLTTVTANKKYTVDITPTIEGKVTINLDANKVENSGGNGNTQADPLSFYYDATAPTVQLSTNAVSPTATTTISVNIDFNEAVTGFTLTDITVNNGTASNFVAVSEKQFTADITLTANTTVTIDVVAGVTTDKAGNNNTAANQLSIVSDKTGPTVAISSTVTGTTNHKPVKITIEFNETVSGFNLSDMTVGNGYVTNLFELTAGTKYEANLFATTEGEVTVDIAANMITDVAGNGNSAATQYSIVYDGTRPAVTILTQVPELTNSSPFGITIDFSEAVSGFELTDIVVVNGTAGSFVEAVAGTQFTANITPTSIGTITVDVTAYSATDNAGNDNTAATQLSVTYDNIKPTVVISSQTNNLTNENPLTITIDFSKEVSSFDLSDITVSNGTVDNLIEVIAGKQFTAGITPSEGTVTANIAAGVATDAAGNSNTAANQFSRTYDGTPPGTSISTTAVSPTNNTIELTIEFTEKVYGFGLPFIFMGNATGTNFVEVEEGLTYTATAVPNSDGKVTIYVADGVTNDEAGNGNTASSTIVIEYEGTAPILNSILLNGVTANSANFTLIPHKDGNVYYQVLLPETTPPTVNDILGSLNDSVVVSGNMTIEGEIENELLITGLSTNQKYILYMVTQDALGNNSSVYRIDFSTNFVDLSDTKGFDFQVYPNPNSGVFQIDLADADINEAFITVHDLKGNKIANIDITEQKQTIDLGEQPQGVYFMKVHLHNEVFTHRFVIE